tara:strand:- start:1283 stop:1447 length:165 start_codon:yes stop_codon:yes gene_type:complete
MTHDELMVRGLALPVIVMDDDFFDYLEDETSYTGGDMDIGLFALYVIEWEKALG